MVEHLGDVIRSIRRSAGITLGALASATTYSVSNVCNIEAGRRSISVDFAHAADQLFGTTPLLVLLHTFERQSGDDVNRRAFMSTAAMAIGMTGAAGSPAVAEVVRTGLIDGMDAVQDWDPVIADYERRSVVAPTQAFASSLLAKLAVVREQIASTGSTPERLRAAARLGQLYGLWLGNQGEVAGARSWYRTAQTLAQRSGDDDTHAYVAGRALSRGVYEGSSARETLAGAHEVLSLRSTPCPGLLEAHSALVHVHALTGNLRGGRAAVEGMARVAEALPDEGEQVGPTARTAHFRTYLECRLGTFAGAQKAFGASASALRAAPVWDADAKIYFGLAQVRAGDVAGGIRTGLDAITAVPDVQVLRVGVKDLLRAVPAQHRSTERDELATYAATGPAPWETV